MSELLDNVKFIRKKQNNSNNGGLFHDENYFLQPHIKIVLNNPIVYEINPKYLVFKCSDDDILQLSELSDKLINKFKECIVLNNDTDTVHPLLQKKNLFRCSLPCSWSKYSNSYTPSLNSYDIQFYTNYVKRKFKLNYINKTTNINKVVIYIKNIWNSNNKCGIHCTVDEIYID
jgi:hypothetical protein